MVDTVGAGDVYAAGLIDALVKGKSIIQAMQEAVVWSAYAVASPVLLLMKSYSCYNSLKIIG